MAAFLEKLKFPKEYTSVLAVFLLTDLFFILLHITHKVARWFDLFTTIRKDAFNLYYDLTLAESFQYVKEYWIFILIIWMMFRHKNFFFAGWALMFVYLLFDDMLGFHEGLGTFILKALNIPPFEVLYGELRYQDFGELAVSVGFGLIFLVLIALAYIKGGREVRHIFHYLIAFFLVIVFFGVFNDLVNRVFDEDTNKIAYEITRLIEDGGEMIGMSLMCWYVFTLAASSLANPASEKLREGK